MDLDRPKTSGIPKPSKLPVARAIPKPTTTSHQSIKRTEKGDTEPSNSAQAVATKVKAAEASVNVETTLPKRKARKSLADRTVETLSMIPPSPSPARRRSSFFTSQSPMPSPTRPHSSMNGSRPSISQECVPPIPPNFSTSRPSSPSKHSDTSTTKIRPAEQTPYKRMVSSHVPRTLPPSHSKLNRTLNGTTSGDKSTIVEQHAQQENDNVLERKGLNDAWKGTTLAQKSQASQQRDVGVSGQTARNATRAPRTLTTSRSDTPRGKTSVATSGLSPIAGSPKSSAALRETIAKAKAAHRTTSKLRRDSFKISDVPDTISDMDLGGSGNTAVLNRRIRSARMDGRLNIAAMGLKDLPAGILTMYDTAADAVDGSWAESVDLVKLIAADNEIASIESKFFPSGRSEPHGTEEDESLGSVLASVESIDLHGNLLRAFPPGIENLQYLTILNLSRNRLDNSSLTIISKVQSLREVHLAENMIEGCLSLDLYGLPILETLDLSRNAITQMADGIMGLSSLSTLNLAGNKLTSLPDELIASMSLRHLNVSKNGLRGSLLPDSCEGSVSLSTLDVSFNALDSIANCASLSLPALQVLNVSENRLKHFPDISGSPELTTLVADGNKLMSLPMGFTSLSKLRNVDFSRNDIRLVDESIGFMESLTVFSLANNPLRERRLLNMHTEDLKRELRSRKAKSNDTEKDHLDVPEASVDQVANSARSSSKALSVQAGGIIDRSRANVGSLHSTELEPPTEEGAVKTMMLHHNVFNTIPSALDMLADTLVTLDLSHNKLLGDSYLPTSMSLPKLKVLILSVNALSSLSPLISALTAPSLSELDVSRNRLTTLPILQSTFPSLVNVKAADNNISSLSFESVKGLHVLDVSSNDINFLEPKLGLLAGEGLRMFLVGANTFRVPRRDVVDKGSEAILTWLRDRIPDDE